VWRDASFSFTRLNFTGKANFLNNITKVGGDLTNTCCDMNLLLANVSVLQIEDGNIIILHKFLACIGNSNIGSFNGLYSKFSILKADDKMVDAKFVYHELCFKGGGTKIAIGNIITRNSRDQIQYRMTLRFKMKLNDCNVAHIE